MAAPPSAATAAPPSAAMAAPPSAAMAAPPSAAMAAPPSADMAAPPSAAMAAPPSAAMAAPPSAAVAAPPSADTAAPPSADMAAPPSAAMAAPPSAAVAAPPSAAMAAPPSADTAAPPSADMAAPPSADMAAPPSSDMAAPPSAAMAAPRAERSAGSAADTRLVRARHRPPPDSQWERPARGGGGDSDTGPGWGSPRTCRGRPAPPAALPREEEEEEEEEEVAAEQERLWKQRQRDSSDGTGAPLCPPAGIDRSHKLSPLSRLSEPSLMPGRLRRSRREVLGEKQWRSLEERGSAQLEHPKLTRSRTYESSCKEAEQAATGRQGPPSPSLSKQDSSYRRVFGGLAEQDALLGCFSCAWQREMPYHGRLYVSSRHICFHSSLLLKDIKAVVPVASISALKKTNTALLVPNAISIRTAKGEKFLFVALRQREATYQLLRSVCKHLQDSGQSSRDSASWEETLGKSQMLSQSAPEQSTPEPNSLQEALGHLDCSLGHSPSVSRSPADEPNLRSRQAEDEDGEVALLVPRSSEWVPSAKTHGLWGRPHSVLCAWATALWSWINPQLSSLNIIITIYLLLMVALLLSSGYIGLRIAELEQQLSFAGAGPDLNLSQQYKTT
nr:BRD4-interacting chromatin-remodeling complex-associated protein [Taeniopygia guttata]